MLRNITKRILNVIFLREYRFSSLCQKFINNMRSEMAEDLLVMLLRLLCLYSLINVEFRRNIINFKGKIVFANKSGSINVSVIFANGFIRVKERVVDNADVKIVFLNEKVLINMLCSAKMNVLEPLLTQEISTVGNLNYLYKFGYLATFLSKRFLC